MSNDFTCNAINKNGQPCKATHALGIMKEARGEFRVCPAHWKNPPKKYHGSVTEERKQFAAAEQIKSQQMKLEGPVRCTPGVHCALLERVIRETERRATRGNGAGLGIGIRMKPKGKEAATVVVCSTGRAGRESALNFVLNFCPFCGAKTR